MNNFLLSKEDISEIETHGLSPEEVIKQLAQFEKGVSPLKLNRPCTVGDGIVRLADDSIPGLHQMHSRTAASGRLMKFVPASGAATRMFRSLSALLSENANLTLNDLRRRTEKSDKDAAFGLKFFEHLDNFAFFPRLNKILSQKGIDFKQSEQNQNLKPILRYLLTPEGLNYASLPKGLIEFHRSEGYSRTAFEEHLVEALEYASGEDSARLHFTVAPEHREDFQTYFTEVRAIYESEVVFEIEYSIQKLFTDTVAVDLDNKLFRDDDGKLLFRPGGHGALLENLNDLDADIIFIKNIDNVVPDRLKGDTYRYKKALCGYLVGLQEKVFRYLEKMDDDSYELSELEGFAREELQLQLPQDWKNRSDNRRSDYLFCKLNRPLRVCGMVQNVGEPGGGPFWVEEEEGTASRQIVEMAQIDMNSPEQKHMVNSATHFNPVDLVCGLRDYKGRKFDLLQFRNPDTGFIAKKSKAGRELKALELPGLWNGSMWHWNTIFIEVPASTFNPVKTVNDLLRSGHRG